MRRIILCVVLAASSIASSAGSPAWGQQPTPIPAPTPAPAPTLTISGATTITEGSLVSLNLTGGQPGSVAWLVLPDVSQFTSGPSIVFTSQPGTYTVIALAVVGSTPEILKTSVTITPAEQAKPLMIAIWDPSTLTSLSAGQVAIYQSTTIAATLSASGGTTWLSYSISDVIPTKGGSSPMSQTTYGSRALAIGLPALVTVSNGATNAIPLPQTEAEIVGMARRVRSMR